MEEQMAFMHLIDELNDGIFHQSQIVILTDHACQDPSCRCILGSGQISCLIQAIFEIGHITQKNT